MKVATMVREMSEAIVHLKNREGTKLEHCRFQTGLFIELEFIQRFVLEVA